MNRDSNFPQAIYRAIDKMGFAASSGTVNQQLLLFTGDDVLNEVLVKLGSSRRSCRQLLSRSLAVRQLGQQVVFIFARVIRCLSLRISKVCELALRAAFAQMPQSFNNPKVSLQLLLPLVAFRCCDEPKQAL